MIRRVLLLGNMAADPFDRVARPFVWTICAALVRVLAIADGLIAAAEIGLKEHDRLALARKMMERKLLGRRVSSKLPELIELVMATPLVHAGTVTKTLGVTPQAARRIVTELGLREMTGRGRFRAWGVI